MLGHLSPFMSRSPYIAPTSFCQLTKSRQSMMSLIHLITLKAIHSTNSPMPLPATVCTLSAGLKILFMALFLSIFLLALAPNTTSLPLAALQSRTAPSTHLTYPFPSLPLQITVLHSAGQEGEAPSHPPPSTSPVDSLSFALFS
jgi:hypothetical protein